MQESGQGATGAGAGVARVAIDRSAGKEFDYLIPEALAGRVRVGARVRVPLGPRMAMGTVMSLPDHSEIDVARLRPIGGLISALPEVTPGLMRLAEWMADYYCCTREVALRAVLPQVVRGGKMRPRSVRLIELGEAPGPEELARLERRAPRQAAALVWLRAAGRAVTAAELAAGAGAGPEAIRALVRRGWMRERFEEARRDPHAGEEYVASAPHVLNEEQVVALDVVLAAMDAPEESCPVLLHGVTGSGKTEIYLQAIRAALDRGRSAIVLVPEISLTPQTVERFRSRFADLGQGVAVLHSHLSEGERYDEWHRIRAGEARIAIGARSAVFAPLSALGLIVVDEEHEPSYKQEDAPRYHGRDLAVMRGRMEGCAVLLGSATPSMESYRNARLGKYRLVELRRRVDSQRLPLFRIVDMRTEATRVRGGAPSLLSSRLCEAVRKRLDRGEQCILFLNKRGYASSLICAKCGHVCMCEECSVSLTLHRADRRLLCHLCGHAEVIPARCPGCGDEGIRHRGAGTERVEDAVVRAFAGARIARMDSDTMGRKGAYRETLGAFRAGKIDILVGTQMIAKGLHFPSVTLVGIVNADLGLHLPDFRAAERTFQLLVQVAGRAGRGEMEGEVYVQSHTPFSPAIQHARHHDYEGFYEQEAEFREMCGHPPFAHVILVTVRSKRQELAEFTARTLAERLAAGVPEGARVGESMPAPLARVRGEHRYHILLRAATATRLSRHVRGVLGGLRLPPEVKVMVDVDPYDLL